MYISSTLEFLAKYRRRRHSRVSSVRGCRHIPNHVCWDRFPCVRGQYGVGDGHWPWKRTPVMLAACIAGIGYQRRKALTK